MERARGTRWPLVIVAILLKGQLYTVFLHHRAGSIALLAAWLGHSLLRIKLVRIAALSAALLAVALAPHPILLGVGLGAGTFVVLMVVFFAIATALRARDAFSAARPRGATRAPRGRSGGESARPLTDAWRRR